MNESSLNKMIREHKERFIWGAVFLILAVFVTALVFGTLKRSVQAQTYTKRVFACVFAEEGAEPVAHQHNDDCYENGELICTLPERELHVHGDECYEEEKVLVCTLEEGEGHVHTDACYTEEPVLVCGLEEIDGHVHSVENGCYTRVQGDLICTDEDPEHVHTDDCYAWEEVLTCEIPEGDGAHHHSEECYETQRVLSCGKEEGEGAHTHDDTCYEIQKVLICDKEEVKTEHVHTVDCFQVVDMSPEEIHALHMSELPESDPDADVESPDVWESRFTNVPLSGHWDKDLLKIAETQLGYTESERNFEVSVDEDTNEHTMKGWTRYGAWYGIPYGDWSAMFASFCLNYADVPESAVPHDCETESWISSLSARGMFVSAGSYDPKPGDLIFFDWEGDGISDHVGIVWAVNPDSITSIEGDHTSSVELFDYSLSDSHILGYGILPVNPNAPVEENTDTEPEMPAQHFEGVVGDMLVTVDADEGAFPAGTTMTVEAVEDEDLEEKASSAVSGEVVHVAAVDITFKDAEDNEIEPLIPIRVAMQPLPQTETVEADYVEVVHVDDNGGITTVTTNDSSDQPDVVAAFDSDAFSKYYFFYVIDTYYRSFTGETFKVTLDYNEDTGIPAGAALKVQEILHDSPEYKEYYDQAMAVAGSENPEEVPEDRYARFFDIEIWKGEQKIEPQGPVSVSIVLQDVPEDVDEQWSVVHFNENGPEVLASEETKEVENGTAEMTFVSDSFSVYGVVTFPTPPQGVTDLGGRQFYIKRNNGNYLTSNIVSGTVNKFQKTSNKNEATLWEFESAGHPAEYFIFTYQNGTKRYMHLDGKDSWNADAALSEIPQVFKMYKNDDNGMYIFETSSEISGKKVYYLNEFLGQDGFAGWGDRSTDDDRFVLEFNQPVMQDNKDYMVLVKRDDQYYIVRNDGSLASVTYQNGIVYVDDPMLWKYSGNNIYHDSRAVGYNYQQLPSDSYYRYFDPNSPNGLNEETEDDVNVTINPDNEGEGPKVAEPRKKRAETALTYENNKLRSNVNSNFYMGVEEIDGKLYLRGQASENEAVEFFFADATRVSSPLWVNHAVNHIDISIKGTAQIDVPLGYGEYYNREGRPILNVTKAEPRKVTLTEDQVTDKNQLRITYEDMKRSSISAYIKKDNGEPDELDNAFFVSGYSANAETTLSTVQVRIEGSFKVANLDWTVDTNRYDNDNEYKQEVYAQRLNNKVYYTVTVLKPVTFNVVHPETHEQLYDANGNPLTITADVAFSDSFDYWDKRNECPPLRIPAYGGGNGEWEKGWIPEHNLSGMDFKLGGQTEVHTDLYAIEITKIVMDEKGNRIRSNNAGNNTILIYKNEEALPSAVEDLNIGTATESPDYEGYLLQQTKQISVGKDGMGIVYAYNVTPGMYYVNEDPNSIPTAITDLEGNNWTYKETYFETEYAWRGDDSRFNGSKPHVSFVSPTENENYSSVPEVLGPYPKYQETEDTCDNQYLEFYVYNIYQPATVDVPVEKTWTALENSEYNWSSTFKLQWAPLYEGQTSPNVAFRDVDPAQEITITKAQMADLSGSAEARTFKDLPKFGQDNNGTIYRIQYSLEETSYKVWTTDEENPLMSWTKEGGYSSPDEETQYEPFYLHDAGELSEENSDYYIIVANALRKTEKEYINFNIAKKWDSSATDLPDDWSADFVLRRYVHTEYRDLSKVKDEDIVNGTRITLTLVADGQQVDSILVYPNTGIYLAATFAPHTERKSASFSYGGNTVTVNALGSNQGKETVRSNEIFLVEDTVITLTGGSENLVDGVQGTRIMDTRAGTYAVPDTSYPGESFTLNKDNLNRSFSDVLSRETSRDEDGNENVTVYEYYFEETHSTPESSVSFFAADGNGNQTTVRAGDQANRIETNGQSIVALNKSKSNLTVQKVWRGVPDTTGYPEVSFTLYQGWIEQTIVWNSETQQNEPAERVSMNNGSYWVYDNGKYTGIKLNETNHWTWTCPENLPTIKEDPSNPGTVKNVGYFVKEDQQNGGDGSSKWAFYYYSNSRGLQTNSYEQGGYAGLAGNEGTLYIHNKMNSYIQMDIKKQYFEIREAGAWYNVTAQDYMCSNVVLGFKVLRRVVFPDGHKSAWMDYGDEMLCGYGTSIADPLLDNGDNGFFLESAGGDWHFRIRDQGGDLNSEKIGLPGYGYYVDGDGNSIPVGYEYSYRETGVYKDLNRTPYPEWGWWSTSTPDRYTDSNGQVILGTGDPTPKAFPNQDEDRIANAQASDLEIVKEWLWDTDVQEIYIKIYRYTTDRDNPEDFTAIIASDITGHHNWAGYVTDPGVIDTTNNWLILAPSSSDQTTASVKINGLLPKTIDGQKVEGGNGFQGDSYHYYIQEVGYKDKEGIVHLGTGTGSVQIYDPHYDKWIDGHWEGTTKVNPISKAISIGALGENRLKVINAPTMDLTVEKKWVDENGADIDPWNNIDQVSFRVRMKFTKYENGVPAGESQSIPLIFTINGETTELLTVKTQGQKITLLHDSTNDNTAHNLYSAEITEDSTVGNWKTVIDGLQPRYLCDNGDEYHCVYYIIEEAPEGGRTTITGDSVSESGHTVIITNTQYGSGALRITKRVTVNGQPVTLAEGQTSSPVDGTYKFQIFKEDGITPAAKADGSAINDVEIVVSGGQVTNPESGYAIVDGLTPGSYVIKELSPANGAILVLAERGDGYASAVNANKEITVVVTEKDHTAEKLDAQALFTNNVSKTDIVIRKVDQDGTPISGAVFSLYRKDSEDGTAVIVETLEDIVLDEETHFFTIPEEGITLKGLGPGYYELREEFAPSGYLITIKSPVTFTIDANGTITDQSAKTVNYQDNTYTVTNTAGQELPKTGGPGTALFALIGGLLVGTAGAALILFRKKNRG